MDPNFCLGSQESDLRSWLYYQYEYSMAGHPTLRCFQMKHYPALYHEESTCIGLSGGFKVSNMMGSKFITHVFSSFSRLSRSFWRV